MIHDRLCFQFLLKATYLHHSQSSFIEKIRLSTTIVNSSAGNIKALDHPPKKSQIMVGSFGSLVSKWMNT